MLIDNSIMLIDNSIMLIDNSIMLIDKFIMILINKKLVPKLKIASLNFQIPNDQSLVVHVIRRISCAFWERLAIIWSTLLPEEIPDKIINHSCQIYLSA